MGTSRSLLFVLTLFLPAFAPAQPVPSGTSVKSGDDPVVKKEQPQNKNNAKRKGKNIKTPAARYKHTPEWVLKGGAAFKDSGRLAYYGVGSAPGTISDEYLRRETADNRARADIRSAFSISTESTGTITHMADGAEKMERSVTTFKSGEISMAQITERYQAPDGTFYSLAKIEIKQQ